MPRIRREGIPAPLWRHLFDRIREREISEEQIGLLSEWLETNPEVPIGRWFKRFSGRVVCGE
ncbi:MAG: hypothetical protein ABR526_05520 [Chthoniobacterales bacterium]